MIADAVDALITLARSLAAHDTITVPAYLAMVVAVAALLCGHQGQPWPLAGLWRTVYRFAGARRVLYARLRPEAPESVPRVLRISDRRSTPRWALPPGETPEPQKPQKAA